MSDYQDLCERYGRSPNDPEFIDDLIDDVSRETSLDQYDYEWYEENENKKHYQLLIEQLDSVDLILELEPPEKAKFSFLVMVHAHVVSTIEAYLAGVFIHQVCNSEVLTRKLVETDPEFSKRKFTLREIYQEKDALKVTVASYLKGLIFHDIKKIKPMYESVLGHKFSDLSWLFKAVETRHHCVHRAGYDKDGNKVDISAESIVNLLEHVTNLANEIDSTIETVDSGL
ncbi:hypothetical protein [Marinobacter sp. F3R08]|uniref:hypothetical protein n=1 Tax=Marinobacter sp. F3R08 TaxID=2841559 RepID=UPI001C093B6E|nr:hypothetical protein [Marinobacter sp. F3R08]MBU2955856.1 hypothetical protein [Marinobacter sp. F3R08]